VVGYFKDRNALQFPALILVAILLKLVYVGEVLPAGGYPDPGGLLVPFINQKMVPVFHARFLPVFSLILLLGSAIYANVVVNNRRMFSQRHALLALCFLLFTGLFPGTNLQLPALLLVPVQIGIFSQLTQLYQSSSPRSIIFNVGMLAGTGYLLYHPFVFLLPGCFIGLAYMRPFRLAEWLLLLISMFTPLYFILSGEYIFDNWYPERHLIRFPVKAISLNLGAFWWTSIAVIALWLAAAFSAWQVMLRRMVIQGRKNWYSLLMMAVFALPGIVIPFGNQNSMLALLAFPLSGLLSNAFATDKRSIGQLLLFWLVVLAIALVTWGWLNGKM
jgi:hypothetical protein